MSSIGVQVFVGNLPDNCKGESLRDLFSPYGEITDLTVVKNYAFLTFAYKEDANKAVQDLHKSKMFGRELTVEIAKAKQQPRSSGGNRGNGGGDRKPPRDDNRRRSSGLAVSSGFPGPQSGGGILGIAPGANLPGGLGLLSAVNNVVAAAASGRQAHDMYDRNDHNVHPIGNCDLPTSRNPPRDAPIPPAPQKNLADGYVIYERYYVDPKHPLLKGLPIPELPRVTDSYVSQDVYQSRDSYPARQKDQNVNDFRDRSPLQARRNFDFNRESSRDYNNGYFDRR